MFQFLNFKKAREKSKEKVKVNQYIHNIQVNITAYELYIITHPIAYKSYKELDAWYDGLPELTKRHIIKKK